MVVETYISIITANVNGLKSPTKRERLVKWIEKHTPLYAVYKRPISNLGIHTD